MMTTPASVFVSTRDPKVLCSTRIKSKRNSSRLHMHREAKNCDLSLENVADGYCISNSKQFSSYSNGIRQARVDGLQIRQTSTACTSSENIVIPSNGSSYPFKKHYCHLFERPAGAISSNNNRQLFEPRRYSYRQKQN